MGDEEALGVSQLRLKPVGSGPGVEGRSAHQNGDAGVQTLPAPVTSAWTKPMAPEIGWNWDLALAPI